MQFQFLCSPFIFDKNWSPEGAPFFFLFNEERFLSDTNISPIISKRPDEDGEE
jgi:hypothetical protein